MRVLCLYIEHFAAVVERKACPELFGRPIVIGGFPHERKPVFDCSAEAATLGIAPGLPLRKAHHLCPEAIFLPLDEPKYTHSFEEVLAILDRFSPAVESDAPARVFMDATGLGKRSGTEEILARQVLSEVSSQTGLQPRIGLGNCKFVAEVAARISPPGEFSIVREGKERDFLAPLAVELLPVSEETKRRLKLLGLFTLGQLSALPVEALVGQFGQEGLLTHGLANGIDKRAVVPRPKPVALGGELSFENPLETVEAVVAAVSTLLDRLLPGLHERGQVCSKLSLRFDFDGDATWQESLGLKTPSSSRQVILSRIRRRLETVRFPGGVSAAHLALAEFGGEPVSQSPLLGSGESKQEAAIGQAARQLQVRLGKSPLKRVVDLDPRSRIPERRAALVDFP